MSQLVYPDDFREKVEEIFNASKKDKDECDILEALRDNRYDLGALLSRYEQKIPCRFSIQKEERGDFVLWITQTIQVINYIDPEGLEDDVTSAVWRHKIELMNFRDCVERKDKIKKLCEWWQRIYDKDRLENHTRRPKEKN